MRKTINPLIGCVDNTFGRVVKKIEISISFIKYM